MKTRGGVGEGARSCGTQRETLFITTKLAAEMKNYKDAAAAIDGSHQKPGLSYIDLMLIHSPQPWANFSGGGYAQVDFEISEDDMDRLKQVKPLAYYGEYSAFPVFSGKE